MASSYVGVEKIDGPPVLQGSIRRVKPADGLLVRSDKAAGDGGFFRDRPPFAED
jgi:hypothetical protein